MRALLNKVKWAAIGVLAVAVTSWLWPPLAYALTAVIWVSWAVVAAVLLHAVPVPGRVRAGVPVVLGYAQRVGTTVPLSVARAVALPWTRSRFATAHVSGRLRGPVFAWVPPSTRSY